MIPTSDRLINTIITGKIFFTSRIYSRKIMCFSNLEIPAKVEMAPQPLSAPFQFTAILTAI